MRIEGQILGFDEYMNLVLDEAEEVRFSWVWYGLVWYGMVWYGVAWCGVVVWCGVV